MMDRRQLLDRAARNGDERVLLAHILDKCEQSRNRNIPSATDFLSPAEQRSAQDLLHAAAIHDGCAFCGGFERAERRMLLFLPDWQEEADESEYMTALRCTYRKEDTLTHRDFLGSLMAQGVTREKLGDILVSEGSCDLIVSRDIAPYLLQNVTSAGRVKLSVSEIELSDLSVPELKVKEIRDTVSTLRLDAVRAEGVLRALDEVEVAASGFSMSRGKAQELISSGRVQLNHRETLKSDAPVAQGDVISARGLGKFEVAEVGGLSKKGRTALLLRRYL
jgi:RNA-binding protein YlmH